jgi:hypothetical protein
VDGSFLRQHENESLLLPMKWRSLFFVVDEATKTIMEVASDNNNQQSQLFLHKLESEC